VEAPADSDTGEELQIGHDLPPVSFTESPDTQREPEPATGVTR
jgi:hypothetical protein